MATRMTSPEELPTSGSDRIEQPIENPPRGEEYDRFVDVLGDALGAEARGDLVGALDIVRSARLPPYVFSDGVRVEGTQVIFEAPVQLLTLKAYRAELSLRLGQWRDAPRHDSNSDSPHGFLTMYEMLGPRLPEEHSLLRLFMDRLRVRVGLEHRRYIRAAAWAYDMHALLRTNDSLASIFRLWSEESLVNMAVAMSGLGFKRTADSLYRQSIDRLGESAAYRAAILIRYGSMLWSQESYDAAESNYREAFKALANLEEQTVTTLHDQVRVRARLADCHLIAERWTEAASMVFGAFDVLDAARDRGVYQLARSVDASVSEDIEHLLSYMTRLPVEHLDAARVVKALLIVGNSSTAARLRNGSKRPDARTRIWADELDETARAAVESAAFWRPVGAADVEAVIDSPHPILLTMLSMGSAERLCGLSVLVGAGLATDVRTWSLDSGEDAEGFELLQVLLTPPPGSVDQKAGKAWTRPWDVQAMTALSERLFPVDALARAIGTRAEGIAVVPVGAMWGFPFTAIAIAGQPLGATAPVVLTPGPTINQQVPRGSKWAGHFDLSLAAALNDLRVAVRVSGAAGSRLGLFTNLEEFSKVAGEQGVGVLLFAGHGQVLQRGQRLRLATGETCQAVDLKGLRQGAVVVLNACWTGAVADVHGSDTSEQALQFLVGGAHSVLGTLGPINDSRASEFLAEYLPAVARGRTSAQAALHAIRVLLDEEQGRPLSSWASYATLGRGCEYAGNLGIERMSL